MRSAHVKGMLERAVKMAWRGARAASSTIGVAGRLKWAFRSASYRVAPALFIHQSRY